MLVNLKQIIEKAAEHDYAIGAFNVYGFEDIKAVIEAAEEMQAPVIIMANSTAISHMPIEYIAPIMLQAADDAGIPVCVHLDHATDVSVIQKAIDYGFTSVMYDGSQLPIKENIINTIKIVTIAKKSNVSVEGEVGSVGYAEPEVNSKHILTDPKEAAEYVEVTGIDAVAISIGTVHRMQSQEAEIKFEILKDIQEELNTPLVIHGSSGIRDKDLRKLIKYRVAKINIGTALRMAFSNALKDEIQNNPDEIDRIRLFQKPIQRVKGVVKNKIKILGCENKTFNILEGIK